MVKKKPTVLFVNMLTLPEKDILALFKERSVRTQPVAMPMGILYISSSIKRSGCTGEVGIIDYVISLEEALNYNDLDSFIKDVASTSCIFDPDVLAFSLNFSSSYSFFLRAFNILHQLWPRAVTIAGGVHATNTAKHLIEDIKLDYVACGEGELSMVDFLKALASGHNINVKGIYSQNKMPVSDNKELSDCVENLDELPFPDWDLIEMNRYVLSLGRQRDIEKTLRHASLMTTRGCCFRCTFCSAHTVHGRKLRYRSVDNVLEEMRLLHDRYGVKLFMPEDDLFTASKPRVLALLKAIKSTDIPGLELQFPAALSVNTLDEMLIDALMDAGMRILVLAIESGSPYVQRSIIKKNCNLSKAHRLAQYAKSKGLLVRCYFIAGFPSETKEHIRETIEYAKSLQVDWCVFNIATPLVGSEMYAQFVEFGCIKDCAETWESTVFDERYFDTAELTAAELNSLVYRANLECNFINNPNIIRKDYHKAIQLFQDIIKKHPFHIIAWYCIYLCHHKLGDGDVMHMEKTIRDLIKSDKRAEDMFARYHDIMPDLSLNMFDKMLNHQGDV